MNLSSGSRADLGRFFVNVQLDSSKQTLRAWAADPSDLFKYENLNKLAQQNGIVKYDQEQAFFTFTHPSKLQSDVHRLGWKLHISVDPNYLEKAFDLAAPIISQYCPCFKVTNPAKLADERLLRGAQITIYLEEQEMPVMPVETARKMIQEIDQVLSKNKIAAGTQPESDLETTSSYFSMRNDKVLHMQNPFVLEYCSSHQAGKNANPLNHPNPFGALLSCPKKPFDPLRHFESLGNIECAEFCFYATLYAYFREYTIWDSLDEVSQRKFITQYCLCDRKNLTAQFLKEGYRSSIEILLAVQQAFAIMFVYESDCMNFVELHSHITSSQFSDRYPHDNSFKNFMLKVEAYSKQQHEENNFFNIHHYSPLINFLKKIVGTNADQLYKKCGVSAAINYIRTQPFYFSLAALRELDAVVDRDQYIEILLKNDSLPAAQYELSILYYSKHPAQSKEYLLKAMLSDEANCIDAYGDYYISLMLAHCNFEQLKVLSDAGNAIASYTLAVIYARDVHQGKLDFSHFENVAVNRQTANWYLDQITENDLCKKAVTGLRNWIKKS